ncbi:hypothetical protein E6Q11_06085 [Candidatus Dojkabacteria bacterium]|uniref:NAD(+) hydrolase ThsA n=1 Tax=Candidatus Dojkabacteria bacterium TaxID=2099670 RepID=A0A5C7J307_9BACT|nr:MAG: hypothetical protein E6Q11_06085 [Candidatus Dojkabacteria bacterium]
MPTQPARSLRAYWWSRASIQMTYDWQGIQMTKVSIERFVEDYSDELEQQNAAIFAGAGLSVAAGFVDWKGLLKPLADELKLDIDRETDLVRVAQYHVNHHGSNRTDLTNAILNGFSTRTARVTENHRILARLPIKSYWTTNYDQCIEEALKQTGKLPDIKHSPAQLLTTVHGRDAVVYKMHGDYMDAGNAVLCKEDYETYHIKRGDFLTALAGDLLSKMFLFIGFSFADPNLDYVLGRLHTRYGQHLRKHYCFVRKELASGDDKPGELEYRIAKQELFIRDLERYNIRSVMVDAYDDITNVLRMVENRYKSRTIFISGAAHEYGSRWATSDVLQFVHKLGGQLVANDYRLVTGLGLGIGSTVLDGALQQIYHVQRRSLSDQLIIRPFPQSLQGQQLWRAYREDMLDFAGMAVFMFGNKLGGDPPSVQRSNGVMEEFDIACQKGIKVLPLGFTEFVARELYDHVAANFSSFYPTRTPKFQSLFNLLGDATRPLADQLTTTVEALYELQRM